MELKGQPIKKEVLITGIIVIGALVGWAIYLGYDNVTLGAGLLIVGAAMGVASPQLKVR